MIYKVYDLINDEEIYEKDHMHCENEEAFRELAVKLMEDYFELGGTPFGKPIETLMKYITTDNLIALLEEYHYKTIIQEDK